MQSVCLKYAAEQNDIFVCLPTGYGKSFLFEVLPHMEKVFNKRESSIALIVRPLNAIIDDQLHKFGDDCVKVDPAAIGDVALLSGKKYILGHPETILDDRMHDTLLSLAHVGWVVIDEAHCIVPWGPSFRRDYEKLDGLSAIFPDACVMAFTATAALNMRDEITKKLMMCVSINMANYNYLMLCNVDSYAIMYI